MAVSIKVSNLVTIGAMLLGIVIFLLVRIDFKITSITRRLSSSPFSFFKIVLIDSAAFVDRAVMPFVICFSKSGIKAFNKSVFSPLDPENT